MLNVHNAPRDPNPYPAAPTFNYNFKPAAGNQPNPSLTPSYNEYANVNPNRNDIVDFSTDPFVQLSAPNLAELVPKSEIQECFFRYGRII